MIGTANIKTSIVQDVLDNTVKLRRPPIGLNYVAYAVETYPDDANRANWPADPRPVVQL